ncbi:CaiB/BaiF CoA transferase family protein [Rhodococcus sp. Leaf278]|uniref:CaiB/BaiF CoA transferase family protein n=1 Tax=Rhodococcus sp. Leaf278 TaxID=1736319 RepID=UPI0009E94964|nr:CoA transferase [Rhodococcus sp. Leaf278]
MTMPLDGVVVVDFTELLPGPFLTQALVDLGARVIKIERPGGDNARHLGAGAFAAVNRGKEMRTLDLKSDADVEVAWTLLADADIMLEGYRPGVMAKLGLGPDTVRARLPRLVYLSLSGYGQLGPLAQTPGHDIDYAARSGVLALAGEVGRDPAWGPGVPVGDLAAATYGVGSVLAGLVARERTGQGCYIDLAIRDCLAHWLNPRLGAFAGDRVESLAEQRVAALERPAYGVFRCSDNTLITVAAIEDHFWSRLVEILISDEWAGPRYATFSARSLCAEEINDALALHFSTMTSTDALQLLARSGVPSSPVLAPGAAVESVRERSTSLVVDDPTAGPLVRFPALFDHGTRT